MTGQDTVKKLIVGEEDGKEEISIKALQGFYFPDGLDNTL